MISAGGGGVCGGGTGGPTASPVSSDQNRSGASPGVMGGRSRKKSAKPWKRSCQQRQREGRWREVKGQRSGRQPTVGPHPDAAEPLDLFSLWTITLDHSTLSPVPTDTTTTSCVHQHRPTSLPLTPTSCPPIYHFLFSTYLSVLPSLRHYTSLTPCPSPAIGQSDWPHPPLLTVPLARTTLVMYCPTNQDCGNIVNNRSEEKKEEKNKLQSYVLNTFQHRLTQLDQNQAGRTGFWVQSAD